MQSSYLRVPVGRGCGHDLSAIYETYHKRESSVFKSSFRHTQRWIPVAGQGLAIVGPLLLRDLVAFEYMLSRGAAILFDKTEQCAIEGVLSDHHPLNPVFRGGALRIRRLVQPAYITT